LIPARFHLPCLAVLALSAAAPAYAQEDAVLDAMTAEIERAMSSLPDEPKPYYLAVEITDGTMFNLRGEDGGLHYDEPDRRRWADVDLRVGSPEFDSTHELRRSRGSSNDTGRFVPVDDNGRVLRHMLWRQINEAYRDARDRWALVAAERQILVEEEPAPDLDASTPEQELGELRELNVDLEAWADLLRRASARLASSPVLTEASLGLSGDLQNRWFADTEGRRLRHAEGRLRLSLNAETQADDGSGLAIFRGWDAFDESELPGLEEVLAEIQAVEETLSALREAPLENPYNGPAILSDRAAGVFFHEIFGHRVEGHRLKQVRNAQTFKDMVGNSILPDFLSVYDDPTTTRMVGTDLRGHYHFDNQGVRSQRVVLVERGVLQGFLHSRSPIQPDGLSNGHGRRQRGKAAVSRQGNLIVEAHRHVSNEALRGQLRKLARDQGLEYGLLIDEIQGGFTFTERTLPNAFNVEVLVAWRVFADGRPDELVRGLNLIGTPLEAFSKFVGAGETLEVFNGSCGAESGWVPVSAVAPYLLMESIETQRKSKGQETPPLLPPPLPRDPAREATR
jgi:predicted Zn-dependent protease